MNQRLDPQSLTINAARLWQSLMDLATIGATPKGGVRRIALTDLDRQGRDRFVAWCEAAGLGVTVDQIGNLFARRSGADPALPPVMSGSHLDTQPSGGKFDGCYGVLAALEVCRTLDDYGIATRAPLEVAVWTNEEGSRFTPVMTGSGVFSGRFSVDYARAQTDAEGIALGAALDAIGYNGAARCGKPVAAYFEAHIEQGPVLENAGKVIGVVTGALGQRWFNLAITGMEAHAGPTPMGLRRDALPGATLIMQAIDEIGRMQPDTRGTVGYVKVEPNSRNVIPGKVSFSADLRAADADTLAAMEQRLREVDDARMRRAQARVRHRAYGQPSTHAVCARMHERGARCRRPPGPLAHGPGKRRRTRRGPPGRRLPGGDDFRSLQGRHQPQRDRGRQAGTPDRRLQCAAARHAGTRRGDVDGRAPSADRQVESAAAIDANDAWMKSGAQKRGRSEKLFRP